MVATSVVVLLLGLPVHFLSYAVRGNRNYLTFRAILSELRSLFRNPISLKRFMGIGSPVDALEWGILAGVGALLGALYYSYVRTKRGGLLDGGAS